MSQSSSFTIVTPSEVCQHSSNLSKMIKHKSGKVFRWHQDKLHTTLGDTSPVKYSLGSSNNSPSLSNNYSNGQLVCEQRSPSVSSCSTSSSTNTYPQHHFENPNFNNQPIDQQVFYQTVSSTSPIIIKSSPKTIIPPTNKITKPYKARDSFKFFDYTMKKRKRTKRCDQVQPYENVISFTMTGVSSNTSTGEGSPSDQSSNSSIANSTTNSDEKFESTLQEISQYIGAADRTSNNTNSHLETTTDNVVHLQEPFGSVSTAPFSTSTFSQINNLTQPKKFRTSISIKELLN